jgi:inhibitor of KinA
LEKAFRIFNTLKKTFPYTIFPLGDSALVLEFGDKIDLKLNQHIHQIFKEIKQANLNYVTDVVPGYSTLAVFYNLSDVGYERESSCFEIVAEKIRAIVDNSTFDDITNEKKLIEIPVCYSLKFGIDLPELSQKNKMKIEELISIHSSNEYYVFMIGFLPGFAYMGEVDTSIATPRRTTPRQEVDAGSVGIAGRQTGIYPFSSPGGWNIIGRTPVQLFMKNAEHPVLLQQGDTIKFFPITEDEYKNYKGRHI